MLLLFPVAVQGEQAAGEIEAALAHLNACEAVDVIVVARGGGSLEDLRAFNSERVARAIVAFEAAGGFSGRTRDRFHDCGFRRRSESAHSLGRSGAHHRSATPHCGAGREPGEPAGTRNEIPAPARAAKVRQLARGSRGAAYGGNAAAGSANGWMISGSAWSTAVNGLCRAPDGVRWRIGGRCASS